MTAWPVSRVAIIMPAYNEAGNMGRAVRDARAAAPDADIVVINDGSTDATSQLAREAGALVIDLPYNLGIGGAVQTGYKYAAERGYRVVARLDGDGQHDPTQLAALLEPVASGRVDVAIGSRFVDGEARTDDCYRASFTRAMGIRMFAHLVSWIIGQRVTDTTSGFQVCNADVAAYSARNFPTDYPEVEMIAVLVRAGYRICEVPVRMRRRDTGRSSITPARSAYYMLKVTLALLVGMLRKPPGRLEPSVTPASVQLEPSQRGYRVA